jgi:hypothetical protein
MVANHFDLFSMTIRLFLVLTFAEIAWRFSRIAARTRDLLTIGWSFQSAALGWNFVSALIVSLENEHVYNNLIGLGGTFIANMTLLAGILWAEGCFTKWRIIVELMCRLSAYSFGLLTVLYFAGVLPFFWWW